MYNNKNLKIMTTKKNLVKQVLMSTFTAGIFTFAFTACSDNDELLTENNTTAESQKMAAIQNGSSIQPIGLIYKDFITPNDVQILNADTTEIAISKALADKKGISSFVGHPMGIKQSADEMSYLRRTIKEELVGDQYILTVVPAGIGEVLAGQAVELNTGIYVNPNAGTTRSGGSEADKYIDSQNRVHPVSVTILSLPGEEGAMTRSGGAANYGTLTAEQIMNGENFNIPHTRGLLDDAKQKFLDFITSGGHATCDEKVNILRKTGIVTPKKIKIQVGQGKNDTLTIDSRIPYSFALDYTLKFDSYIALKDVREDPLAYLLAAVNPFGVFDVDTKSFKTRLDGAVSFAPEVTIGIGAKAEIPKDKQNVKIASLGNYLFDFQVGPVPIPVVLQPALYLHIDASIEGRVYTGIKYEYESKFFTELNYNKGKGWGYDADYQTVKDNLSFIAPRGTIKAKAGMGVMLGCDVTVAAVAGPTFSVGPMVTAGMDVKIAPWEEKPFTFDANVKLGLHGRAGAKLKLWTLDIADWQTDVVFGPEKTLWECHFEGEDIMSKYGYPSLLNMVKKMRQDAEAEREAYNAKLAAEAVEKAESDKNWNNFVEMMKGDGMVMRRLSSLTNGRTNSVFAKKLLESALKKTYTVAMQEYGKITPDHFSNMRMTLLGLLSTQTL